ncbi:PREDICTED: protein inscuteable homolog [Priapulus caudatus]|uniref:Protein inscuteable homolog n=1 Tax=Priapulus caudatus TaxID=37621 RepID=A0ABM1E9V2_PRICU|nr:PREDICTED: protein inscuteable homolog [Priapulus caudatus]
MRIGEYESPSVRCWMQELRMMTEMECMSMLQGKPVSRNHGNKDKVEISSKHTNDILAAVKTRASIVSTEFTKLFKRLEKDRWANVKSNILKIACHIRSLLHECNACAATPPPKLYRQEEVVMHACAKLVHFIESFGPINGRKPAKATLVDHISALTGEFRKLIDLILSNEIHKVVHCIDTAENIASLKYAVSRLTKLGLEGDNMCAVIAKEGGVRALLSVCMSGELDFAWDMALRGLATICCVADSIAELEKGNGIYCLTEILFDQATPVALRAEAAGVVAQVTSPLLDHCHKLQGFMENLEELIYSLTELCREAQNPEFFLLGAAAIANISFIDNLACEYIKKYHTTEVFVDACRTGRASMIFAKDQIATVFANMAAVERCRCEIVEKGGLELLMQLLQERPGVQQRATQKVACERVLQKSAIALTRLSCMEEIAAEIVQLTGMNAAIRRITSACNMPSFDDPNIRDLVELRLIDAYNICSGRQGETLVISNENFTQAAPPSRPRARRRRPNATRTTTTTTTARWRTRAATSTS